MFQFNTKPFQHQQEMFDKTKDERSWGVFWEQGTGKTKAAIDAMAWKYAQGEIDALLVVAPNNVHRNWVSDEIPTHLHKSVPVKCHTYSTTKIKTKKAAIDFENTINYKGLAVLTMSYDAFVTEVGKQHAKRFLTTRRCFYILDESTRIKNPTAQRTKVILASSEYAKHKRILTGTPVTQGPFDVYSQMKFLDNDFWLAHGFGSYTLFKNYFGVFVKGKNPSTGQLFDMCTGYRNLTLLERILKTKTSRVTKDEVLDLPPKVYTKRYFEMVPKQRELYDELRTNYLMLLETGEVVTAALALVRLMRLQQITCGYVQGDGDEPIAFMGPDHPRMKCLAEVVEDIPDKAIIWARFQQDVTNICKLLGKRAVRYDGQVDECARIDALNDFRTGEAQFFVANPACCGEGLTITEAKTTVYYNNSYNLNYRLQSEDRNHRIGQDRSVQYIDIVCQDSVDEKIVQSLVTKNNIAAEINGDTLKAWL